MSQMGHNSDAGQRLLSFIERIERLETEKGEIGTSIREVYAEAKVAGFVPKTMREIIKRRRMDTSDRQEDDSLLALYEHSIGMADEGPLFRHVNAALKGRQTAKRAIETLAELCPSKGDIIVRIGKDPKRIWRDDNGVAHVDDWSPEGIATGDPPPDDGETENGESAEQQAAE